MRRQGMVQAFEARLEAMIKAITVTILAVLCVNVFVQVVCRYVFSYSSRWTLEVSRYLMIWAVMLACGPALKHGVLVGVDMLIERVGAGLRVVIISAGRVLMGLFAVVTILQAIKLMQSQWEMNQLSPALEIPIAFVYLAIPVGLLVFLFYLVLLTCTDLQTLRGQ
jgi:TRAP-type C4-dicarboxylate transport system permease small subunit